MSSPLLRRVVATFANTFDTPPAVLVRAPGRVNLIGEHTDYNGGFVLPCAIDYQTLIAAAPRDDKVVRVVAADYGNATDEFRLDAPITRRADAPWANYVRGMVSAMLAHGLPLHGAELAVAGDVPQGAGLSSSASLEVAVGQAFKALLGLHGLDATTLAQLAQRAENGFVGMQCGIMDQLIAARGQAGHALLIDCRSLVAQPVPIPDGVAVMIVHSNIQRGLVDSAYNERRAQCEAAARHYGVAALRDLDPAQLAKGAAGLEGTVFRRARHIVTENARTLAACVALAAGDLPRMGRLMAESHLSMRDDFQITVPAIDHLVELLQQAITAAGGQGGARMTGGGFGGCAVALMPQALVPAVREAVAQHYRSPEGLPGTVYVCHAADGAATLPAPWAAGASAQQMR